MTQSRFYVNLRQQEKMEEEVFKKIGQRSNKIGTIYFCKSFIYFQIAPFFSIQIASAKNKHLILPYSCSAHAITSFGIKTRSHFFLVHIGQYYHHHHPKDKIALSKVIKKENFY
jgi:hypothetical protein